MHGRTHEMVSEGELMIDTNSRGFKIHTSDEGVKNFHQWFADSAVRDSDGRPLVVFHGTGDDVGNLILETTFWTEHPHIASIYASAPTRQVQGKGPNIVPVYLRILNPYVHDDIGTGENLSHAVLGKRGRIDAVMAKLKSQGYDGIKIINYHDLGGVQDQWVSFYPEQVKSAIGNNGAFLKNSYDVLDQISPAIGGDQLEPAALTNRSADEFFDWFDQSKITCANGHPILAYHGSNRVIDGFRPVTYFTRSAGQAQDYANSACDISGTPIVHPVFLRIINPAIVSDDFIEWAGNDADEIEKLARLGHDGMMNPQMTEIVTFNQGQVRHASHAPHITDLHMISHAKLALKSISTSSDIALESEKLASRAPR